MSAEPLRRQVTDLCTKLTALGYAQTFTHHILELLPDNLRRVTWAASDASWRPSKFSESGYKEYLEMLRARQFSLLLNDGAMLQISYTFRRNQICRHRLCYFPCPIDFDVSDLQDEIGQPVGIEDFLASLSLAELCSRLRVRPSFRFEYDPERADDEHPISHLHMGRSESRIPVCSPLTLPQFTRFIFKNFYPDIFQQAELWDEAPPAPLPREIWAIHLAELHLAAQPNPK